MASSSTSAAEVSMRHVIREDKLIVELILRHPNADFFARDGPDSDPYKQISKWCNLLGQPQTTDCRRLHHVKEHLYMTDNGLIFDSSTNTFVSVIFEKLFNDLQFSKLLPCLPPSVIRKVTFDEALIKSEVLSKYLSPTLIQQLEDDHVISRAFYVPSHVLV